MKPNAVVKRASVRGNSARSSRAADELFESIVKVLLRDSRITCSRMFGSMGLKVDGKVFAMFVKDKLVVKLPQERVEALVVSGDGKYFDPGHGRLMKEWVAVKPSNGDWLSLAKEAKDFVAKS